MRLFLDCEFTGLHQHTTLISMALYADEDCFFYAEFNDYDPKQVTEWLELNVLAKLNHREKEEYYNVHGKTITRKGTKQQIAESLKDWLKQFDVIEIWADVLAYDWVLFCELFGGALGIPDNIFYAPFDIATLLMLKGEIIPIDKHTKDKSRYELAGVDTKWQHNALSDARTEEICYRIIQKI